jgi:hypothetical protein
MPGAARALDAAETAPAPPAESGHTRDAHPNLQPHLLADFVVHAESVVVKLRGLGETVVDLLPQLPVDRVCPGHTRSGQLVVHEGVDLATDVHLQVCPGLRVVVLEPAYEDVVVRVSRRAAPCRGAPRQKRDG